MMDQKIRDKENLETIYEIEKKLKLTFTWNLQNEEIFGISETTNSNQMM